ncbi:hypothetical protein [Palleronia sp.]|uniref:hypothetical protein n=1 Tax=Palleronia sp. TaxID=1940284 RepID=UPI0035C79B73
MTSSLDAYKDDIEKLENRGFCRKCLRVLENYLSVRPDIHVVTKELLNIFVEGVHSRADRLARALSRVDPSHPDLPVIYAMKRGLAKHRRKPAALCCKGSIPKLSIPVDEVPEDYRELMMNFKEGRTRENHFATLRRILGAARRAHLPERVDRDSIVAFRREAASLAPKNALNHMGHTRTIAKALCLDPILIRQLDAECQHFSYLAEQQESVRKKAFRANPVTPLVYAEQALFAYQEAMQVGINRQTQHKLFTVAGMLSFLSYDPERLSDFGAFRLGENIFLDPFGWHSDFLSRKTSEDRSIPYFPKILCEFLNDLILLGADPSPDNLHRLYAQRAAYKGPLFATAGLVTGYQNGHLSTLVKERTGHGPHAARKAMTDYLVRNGGSIQDVMDMLGHRSPETAKEAYEVFAPQFRRERASAALTALREADAQKGPRRNPATGRLVDPKVIYRSDQSLRASPLSRR